MNENTKNSDIIENFEAVLQQQHPRPLLTLYKPNFPQTLDQNPPKSAQEVIANVSKQIRAIQGADCVNSTKKDVNLNKYKKSSFLPVNMMRRDEEPPPQKQKFDTQLFTDTQLINVVQDAEEQYARGDISEDLDDIFGEYERDDVTTENKTIHTNQHFPILDISLKNTNKLEEPNPPNESPIIFENIHKDIESTFTPADTEICTQVLNECMEIDDEEFKTSREEEARLSPVISIKMRKPSRYSSPYTFNLDTFEQFEQIAIPVIETITDSAIAKQMINSQIIDKELFIDTFTEPYMRGTDQISPIIGLSNEVFKVDKESLLKKEKVDAIGESKSKSSSFSDKSVFKDEILFSSDEEDDYVHKSYQDLPFTCALETTFYDHSKDLDKTMYVGFQTANNKSIQISTDSFIKAQTVLVSLEKDFTNEGTLTDLVKAFDRNIDAEEKSQAVDENMSADEVDNKENKNNTADCKETDEYAHLDFIDHEIKNEYKDLLSQELHSENVTAPKETKRTHNCETVKENHTLVGFKTAGNKVIELSDKALEKAKKLFQDIKLDENADLNTDNLEAMEIVENDFKEEDFEKVLEDFKDDFAREEFEEKKDSDPSDQSRKEDNSSNHTVANAKQTLENIGSNENIKITEFGGFRTASNKKLQISEEALAKSRKIFEGIDDNNAEHNTHNDFQQVEQNSHGFVGFKTASNKNISISNAALAKTKKIFQDLQTTEAMDEDIDEMDSNIDKLDKNSEVVSKIGFRTASNKNIPISDAALAKTKKIFQNLEFAEAMDEDNSDRDNNQDKHDKTTEYHSKIGFRTASNKNIEISEAALAKTKKVFQDLQTTETMVGDFDESDHLVGGNKDKDNPTEDLSKIGFRTASNKNIAISEKAKASSKHIFRDIDTCDDFKNDDLTKESLDNNFENYYPTEPSTSKAQVGFKTASNKAIKISEDALTKTKNLFHDIDDDVFIKPVNNKSKRETTLTGFKTASNKKVCISDEALAKSRKFFEEMEFETICGDENVAQEDKEPPFYGFDQTDRDASLLEEAIAMSQKILEQLEGNAVDKVHTEPTFQGFQTAIFKPVSISEDALAKSKKIFEGIDLSSDIENKGCLPKFRGCDTSRSKISEQAVATSKDIFEDIEPNKDKKYTVFGGFKTASNKKVQISEHALAKTRKIFEGIDNNNADASGSVKFKGFQTANNKQVKVSAEALAKSRKIFEGIDDANADCNKETMKLRGFQTANNKQVKVSAEALAKSRKILEGIDDVNADCNKDTMEFGGFQTANNKQVNVSVEALAKSRKIFEGIDDNNADVLRIVQFQGFQTANNKQVKVSAEALAKSRKIFEGIDDVNADCNKESVQFQGFQTANNKQVKVSAEALAKSRKILEGIDNVNADCNKDTMEFGGFQTASNKQVKVSEEALAKSRSIFKGIEDNDTDLESMKFKTFQTANKKEVTISEEALAKSRKILENIDTDSIHDTKLKGFQTASKKNVKVSETALAKSRMIFQDIDKDFHNPSTDEDDKDKSITLKDKREASMNQNVNIHFTFKTANRKDEEALMKTKRKFAKIDDIEKQNTSKLEHIDTQLLNNFEVTLYSEDFATQPTTRTSKRSGSPILSCPKAKKRKTFQTPYSQKAKAEPKFVAPEVAKTNKTYKLDTSYKSIKKQKLKDLQHLEKQSPKSPQLDPYISQLTYETLDQFKFSDTRNDLTKHAMNLSELKRIFLDAVNKKLVPNNWIEIHLRQILWKLISYEMKYPKSMAYICTAKTVLDQLKYRYDKELYNAQRPALRKIMEKDDSPTRTLVLCVAAIYSEDNSTTPPELLLTDGWYSIRAIIDKMLTKLVQDRKIVVGTKLVTHGAELVGSEQAVSPWEDTTSIRLKLFGNSTRRARWHARLGYHGNGAMSSRLAAAAPEGGTIAKLRVYITRVYPMLYVERFQDGSTVTRSERLESIQQMKYETERQDLLEKLYEETEKEVYNNQSQPFQSQIPNSQTTRTREKLLEDIQNRVQNRMAQCGLNTGRNVVPLLKIRVADIEERDCGVTVTKAMLSIWKPNDAIIEIIREGAWIEILNVVPTALRYSELQLSAGRQSVFNQSKYKESEIINPFKASLKRTCYPIKDLVKNPSMTTDYNEIDTIGLIFQIDPSHKDFDPTKHQFQNVFFTDADKNIISVNFWGGTKKFGFEKVLDTGQIVAGTNLQKRAGNTRKNVPQYRATEFSYFTQTPRNERARQMIEDLSKTVAGIDTRQFVEDCLCLKNNYYTAKLQTRDISPYRFVNVDMNSSKNKIFVDSPLNQKNFKDDLNLTGLDFESTFKQTDTQDLSPKTLLRKKQIKEKIAKLRMYGEPPPLSPIQIINKSKSAGNAFKSPLMSKSDVSTSVASEKKNLPIEKENFNEEVQCSPVICLNRTYVKKTNVNPVKLNFSNAVNESNISDVADDFAEDFDGSPPLSLD